MRRNPCRASVKIRTGHIIAARRAYHLAAPRLKFRRTARAISRRKLRLDTRNGGGRRVLARFARCGNSFRLSHPKLLALGRPDVYSTPEPDRKGAEHLIFSRLGAATWR